MQLISERYVQSLKRNLKNIACIRVDNFAETVNFQTSRDRKFNNSKFKIISLKFEYSFLCEEENFRF